MMARREGRSSAREIGAPVVIYARLGGRLDCHRRAEQTARAAGLVVSSIVGEGRVVFTPAVTLATRRREPYASCAPAVRQADDARMTSLVTSTGATTLPTRLVTRALARFGEADPSRRHRARSAACSAPALSRAPAGCA